MSKRLVIVESPAKARKIGEYLGDDYVVESSVGHIRDLPANASQIPARVKDKPWATLGVDVDHEFAPVYVVNPDKKKTVTDLKAKLKECDELLLATDKDREGEAIAWHLMEVLKPKVPVRRMVFGEITKQAIQNAVENTGELDHQLVDAQEARRILDRLYGYEVSPVLWKKVSTGLSAGRVQSVATRIIVERERERMAFVSANYWDLTAELTNNAGKPFESGLIEINGKRLAKGKDFTDKGELASDTLHRLDEQAATALAKGLEGGAFKVLSVETKPYTRKPPAPFATSTLQQEAGRKLRFSSQHTMRVAQALYENGYITYMRTDSYQLSGEAIASARAQVKQMFGADYLPNTPRQYGNKAKNAQEAHEAIRPAGDQFRTPDQVKNELNSEQFRLYELIWKRTLASQMADAKGNSVQARLEAIADNKADGLTGATCLFIASGRTITFPGFLRAYVEGSDDPDAQLSDKDIILPEMKEGDVFEAASVRAEGHDTRPPARYTEASLVQKLEELGVGRPSTYASIIGTIIARKYVWKKGTALVPSFTAFATTALLEQHFPGLVDYAFTAKMEDDLDEIAGGRLDRTPWLNEFYFGSDGPGLKQQVESNLGEIDAASINAIPIGVDEEGRTIVAKSGRFGPYLLRSDEKRGSIPDDICPDELTVEKANEILNMETEVKVLGEDPATGKPIVARDGRFGPYVQIGHPDDGKPEKTASLLKTQRLETLTLEEAQQLLTLPRDVGPHPEDGGPIEVANGRYGPYLKWGKETRSLPDEATLFTIDTEGALALLAQDKKANRATKSNAVLRELGNDIVSGKPMSIRMGRFGEYVTDGEVNASLRKADSIEEMTDERASELLQMRRERMAAQGEKPKKAAAKKATAKKTTNKKSTAKKTTSKKTSTTKTTTKASTTKKAAAKKAE